MRRLLRSNVEDMSLSALQEYMGPYQRVSIDIGTGDGKRLYRVAKGDPDTFYIGIDPVKENMTDTSKKIEKKPEKGGLKNLILVVGAVEALPEELYGLGNEVTVYFPWGSLLESVVKPLPESMQEIHKIARDGAIFTFITTYQTSYEANEIEKRHLPDLSIEYFEGEYSENLKNLGFNVESVTELSLDDVKALGTQWAKRLGSGRARKYFKIDGIIEKK
ncbi:MAG: 16S rRNA (adenine(1408)-N(1))-methyltransferase NpmA [Eubacterium sp.]|nr:16S rRNA (adenine(1408)-N(1))-methyltransferase NpmA [Eubacterium sp.]